jgi:3-oxoacyl-[acyl-carrier-protein] synthase III
MHIRQLSSALPENEYTTEEMMDNFSCELPEGVRQNVLNLGVFKRSFINPTATRARSENLLGETGLVDLCVRACENAVQETDIPLRRIGYFIAAYDFKHVNTQGTASTAFPKALQLAEDHLAGHPEDNVLICISGVSSYWFQNQVRGMRDVLEMSQINKIEDKTQRQMELRKWIATMEYFLFGDAAVAAIASNHDPGLAFRKTIEVTNVDERDYLAGYSRLSSLPEPFKFGFHSYLDKEIPNLGVKYTGLALQRLLGEKTERTIKASKKWAVHTGSQKILDALAEHHRVDPEKLKESHEVLREHGNLSGASLPFILEKIVKTGNLSKGATVLMVGYGWGFSAAASLLEA